MMLFGVDLPRLTGLMMQTLHAQEGSNVQDDFDVFSNMTARQLFHTNGGI